MRTHPRSALLGVRKVERSTMQPAQNMRDVQTQAKVLGRLVLAVKRVAAPMQGLGRKAIAVIGHSDVERTAFGTHQHGYTLARVAAGVAQ